MKISIEIFNDGTRTHVDWESLYVFEGDLHLQLLADLLNQIDMDVYDKKLNIPSGQSKRVFMSLWIDEDDDTSWYNYSVIKNGRNLNMTI